MGLNAIWDEAPVDITAEANFIWSIANKLRGSYMPDKYGDVIIPMVIIRRFECTLEKTKQAVVDMFEKMPTYPYKSMCKISGFQFYNTSQFDLENCVTMLTTLQRISMHMLRDFLTMLKIS